MPQHWNPPATGLEAVLALVLLFAVFAAAFMYAFFWLRAVPVIGRALTQTLVAAHGGPVVVRDTAAINRARVEAARAGRAAGWQ